MKRNTELAKDRIISAGRQILRRVGAYRLTVDMVAAEARCAKGLIHYHFHTKHGLLREILARARTDRVNRWKEALAVDDAHSAIASTWRLLKEEAGNGEIYDGTLARMSSDPGDPDSNPEHDFAQTVGESIEDLLARTGLQVTVPASHVGALVAATVTGCIVRLSAGADASSVEEGYALAWLGILSLTSPD